MIMRLLDQWREGTENNFPFCCKVGFIVDQVVMEGIHTVTPEFIHGTLGRLRMMTPRYSRADGLVPCAYHAAKWALTGQPPMDPRDRVQGGVCCSIRDQSEELLDVSLVPLVFPEYPEHIAWTLRRGIGRLDEMIEGDLHVRFCPWCGATL